MKRQKITPSTLTSPASNSHLKGLQQYFTPEPWARALAAALPSSRRSILDLHCGNGSLLQGTCNLSTREIMSLDLDPAAHPGKPKQWEALITAAPLVSHFTGDVLDLHPLLLETETRFDLITVNPPFSLNWPVDLLHETLVQGFTRASMDSTRATLRMLPTLLTENGEAMLIANQSTLLRLHADAPQDFENAWLWIDLPSFFPGVSPDTRIGVLYLSGNHRAGPCRIMPLPELSPGALAMTLDKLRHQRFTADCITQPWECTHSFKAFTACGEEMERRRDPFASRANITLDTDGRLRTWISAFQEKSSVIEPRLSNFLHALNRKHPLELTLQRGTRMALKEMLDSGQWTIDPRADDALRQAVASFDRDRAPLSPVSDVQRIGWIDDAEELTCIRDIGPFKAGQKYKLSTETVEWKKQEQRPRYHAGKRAMEAVLVRGTDLRITLHHPTQNPVHFIFNPARAGTLHTTYSLEDLAAHFQLPEVPDITRLRAEEYHANLALLDELEALTP